MVQVIYELHLVVGALKSVVAVAGYQGEEQWQDMQSHPQCCMGEVYKVTGKNNMDHTLRINGNDNHMTNPSGSQQQIKYWGLYHHDHDHALIIY